jgi:hypothetical protein
VSSLKFVHKLFTQPPELLDSQEHGQQVVIDETVQLRHLP